MYSCSFYADHSEPLLLVGRSASVTSLSKWSPPGICREKCPTYKPATPVNHLWITHCHTKRESTDDSLKPATLRNQLHDQSLSSRSRPLSRFLQKWNWSEFSFLYVWRMELQLPWSDPPFQSRFFFYFTLHPQRFVKMCACHARWKLCLHIPGNTSLSYSFSPKPFRWGVLLIFWILNPFA